MHLDGRLPQKEDGRHGHIRVLVEDVGLGVVLEVAEVPPVGREALQGRGLSGVGPGHAPLSMATAHLRRPSAASPPSPWLPTTRPQPHLQLPHHKLLGHVVPPGLPEDGGVAQVVLQTPALGLGRRRVRSRGREPPGAQPWAPASPPSSQGTPKAGTPL